ncbi:low-density lipoprotein receptor-like [Pomacea canaliculata]|uniref:low-density lipoprotein receptor-like n=1 Tax=Pomacea canaliculata TaxID=400727 RepID=UPI000D72DD69|nr:low-density lipoprotein receptor-like [Pomacea canaliculata]
MTPGHIAELDQTMPPYSCEKGLVKWPYCIGKHMECIGELATDCSGNHQVKCGDGTCIPSEYLCDGDNDCSDKADEVHCDIAICSGGEVKCSNNICIEREYMCDRDDDCGNGWDEVQANCDAVKAGSGR